MSASDWLSEKLLNDWQATSGTYHCYDGLPGVQAHAASIQSPHQPSCLHLQQWREGFSLRHMKSLHILAVVRLHPEHASNGDMMPELQLNLS